MAKDKVMSPKNVSRKGGIKHTGGGKTEGPRATQLNPWNKKGK